ncbi:MAG: hypothetical protein WKG03_14745 [Telluria sp.]
MRTLFAAFIALVLGLLCVALWLLRYVLFAVLMFVRPFCVLVFGWAAALNLAALILGFLIAGNKHQMLWGFFGLGVASTVVLICYDALVLALAPGRFPMPLAR